MSDDTPKTHTFHIGDKVEIRKIERFTGMGVFEIDIFTAGQEFGGRVGKVVDYHVDNSEFSFYNRILIEFPGGIRRWFSPASLIPLENL